MSGMGRTAFPLPPAAFRRLYRKLQAFLRRRVPQDEVEDVIQTVLYRLVKADHTILAPDMMLAWLYRVAGNEAVDLLRKKKPVPFADILTAEQHDCFDEALGVMLADYTLPEDEMLRSLFWDEFEAALCSLPEEQRFVFEQTEFLGESYKSLSAETGIPVNTLISRKRYAVLRLRERLEEVRQIIDQI